MKKDKGVFSPLVRKDNGVFSPFLETTGVIFSFLLTAAIATPNTIAPPSLLYADKKHFTATHEWCGVVVFFTLL